MFVLFTFISLNVVLDNQTTTLTKNFVTSMSVMLPMTETKSKMFQASRK